MISLTKINRITKIFSLIIFLFVFTFSFTDSYGRTNQNIHRVRPQQGTPQYFKEASRVRLLKLGEQLNLSEEQLIKLRKAQLRMEEKWDKENEKIEKARLKYEKEQRNSTAKQSRYIQDYELDIEKILTPEQLEGYRLMQSKESESLRQIEPISPDGTSSVVPEREGGIGPVIKAQDPPIMH